MKIYVDGKFYDAEKEPIFFIFENDESRLMAAHDIANMYKQKGLRIYAQFPANGITKEDFNRVARLAEERFGRPAFGVMIDADAITEEQKEREKKQILDATNARCQGTAINYPPMSHE